MFSLFKRPQQVDAVLGPLEYRRGLWRGQFRLNDETVPMSLVGSRGGPDPDAIELAKALALHYPSWQPALAAALHEHYSIYADAVASGDLTPEDELPAVGGPGDVWPHVQADFVLIAPLDSLLTLEIGYRVDWDVEHTLGARWRDGRLIELNGSVLRP